MRWAQRIYTLRQQQCRGTNPGARKRGFGTRVTATDDDYVKMLRMLHTRSQAVLVKDL